MRRDKLENESVQIITSKLPKGDILDKKEYKLKFHGFVDNTSLDKDKAVMLLVK